MLDNHVTIAKQVAADAASLLARSGWIQGDYFNDDGFCLAGAIDHCTDSLCDEENVKYYVAEYLGIDRHDLTAWNDHKDRTAMEVISLLERISNE